MVGHQIFSYVSFLLFFPSLKNFPLVSAWAVLAGGNSILPDHLCCLQSARSECSRFSNRNSIQSFQLRIPGLKLTTYMLCHFSSVKLFYAQPNCLLLSICVVSTKFPGLACLWHTYLHVNKLEAWPAILFHAMFSILPSSLQLQHLWPLAEWFPYGYVCGSGCKVGCYKAIITAQWSCSWGCGHCSFRTFGIQSLTQGLM